MNKSQIHLSIATEEMQHLKSLARRNGCSVTWYLRGLIKADMKRKAKREERANA